MPINQITIDDFERVDMRSGTIIKAEFFENALKPAFKLWIDFGELGIKKSSAQLTDLYTPSDLINKQIVGIVNFPPKQIADFMSECLVLGVVQDTGVSLLTPDFPVKNGMQIK